MVTDYQYKKAIPIYIAEYKNYTEANGTTENVSTSVTQTEPVCGDPL